MEGEGDGGERKGRREERGRGRRGPPPAPPAPQPEKGPRLLGGTTLFKVLIKTNNGRAPAGRSAEIAPICRPT